MIEPARADPRPRWAASPDPRLRSRKRRDRLAAMVVRFGGAATIATIVAILGFIAYEVAPLAQPPAATPLSSVQLATTTSILAASTDEYRETLALVGADGEIRVRNLHTGALRAAFPFPDLDDEQILAAANAGNDTVIVATQTRLLAARLGVRVLHEADGRRSVEPRVTASGAWPLPDTVRAPQRLGASLPDGNSLTALVVDAQGSPWLLSWREETSFLGDSELVVTRKSLPAPGTPITAVHVDARGNQAFVGTRRGRLERWDLRDPANPERTDDLQASVRENAPITALVPLIGNQSLVVGDAAGGVGVWFPVRDDRGIASLRRVHSFTTGGAAVTAIAASPRDRGFATTDATGVVRLHHATTERTLLTLDAGERADRLVFAPKADGLIAIDSTGGGRAVHWSIDNPHPEVSLKTLFGRVWYEGYEEPAFVWQSSGGSDAFEPKLSLVPLMVGTLKGTLYALLFAVPLAVLAALYTSQFSHPTVRATVKPVVEIMAALPSVVLGFLAGLWLAPIVEEIVPGVLLALVLTPTLIFTIAMLLQAAPGSARRRLPPGAEILFLCLLVGAGFGVSLALNDPIERFLFGGDFRTWLHQAGWRFDQRNNIVVGVAMGFAVIPLIFTISEDALSNVPQRLVSASLALGATRWQTALKVVMPTASPGIFSAIMIGFGRAVGETMIVLMATGNTPILDWSIFTGMRTLSANIAVEIPEAPHGGSLYRVLFLAALLLFLVTFLTNTAAELVRQRLRRRYQEI